MKIEIIPATDIIDGQVVRLTQGDYAKVKVYYKDPVEAAKRFEDCGLKRLHIVDLDGAKASQPKNLRTLERIATATGLQLQYGGGVKDANALRSVFNAGANRAICGSVAVSHPELFEAWLQEFGGDRLILGADVRGGKVAVKGWLEDSQVTIDDLLKRFSNIKNSIVTDIARDGMLCGPSVDFYTDLQSRYPEIEFTVSGGISNLDDIKRLNEAALRSVIVGKAIYEGRITFKDLEQCSLSE
ncbi:MAG: 1-(5-phosphoribosyl)-5-[(5-phosphoribosylamino)methylideneamino]imidazole-4-carboxamide isomerase [Bacteroidales bacterium]|nr:1-(5-phosphoribosyl)-5-[(5-phosphoribosylamino)methylideneamino]imidazole-4-carboxamide isomerase [Bacteroidales bacterium]